MKKWITLLVLIVLALASGAYLLNRDAENRYAELLSVITYDREHVPLVVRENHKGHYAIPVTALPRTLSDALIKKEDRYFYYHPGINPLSMARALIRRSLGKTYGGSSTLTQQLAKNILGTESDRGIKNKVTESIYALSLELFHTKSTLLTMYANTVFLGNQVQGFETGSRAYFNKPLSESTEIEQLVLLATLSHPSTRNPWKAENEEYAHALHQTFGITDTFVQPPISESYALQATSSFELESAHISCDHTCTTSVDELVTEATRSILKRHLDAEYQRGARNGAVVILDPKTSEIIALVGSGNPHSDTDGQKINMAIEPRPIGSTVKPFIYLKGFMEGLRPYTLVEDREYKYPIATGFSLYPKNFDGQYHGIVTLHEALGNSLNVPSVKILEYIGLENFYTFLTSSLHFTPIQPYESYQYGIALGGLDMDLLTLTHYFTLFPRGGTLAPLKSMRDTVVQPTLPTQSHIDKIITVADPKYVALVHTIISDRLTGVEQFGLKSSLNLTTHDYAVKTGTSRDFHDSWVVGYTPNFVVGVWVGNSENEALDQISGQSGAGAVWHDVMEYLLASPYTTTATFSETHLARFPIKNSLEWGLPEDDVTRMQQLLSEDILIESIHAGDTFELGNTLTVPLRAQREVIWKVNGTLLATTQETRFTPTNAGTYEIEATDPVTQKREILQIRVVTTQ